MMEELLVIMDSKPKILMKKFQRVCKIIYLVIKVLYISTSITDLPSAKVVTVGHDLASEGGH